MIRLSPALRARFIFLTCTWGLRSRLYAGVRSANSPVARTGRVTYHADYADSIRHYIQVTAGSGLSVLTVFALTLWNLCSLWMVPDRTGRRDGVEGFGGGD